MDYGSWITCMCFDPCCGYDGYDCWIHPYKAYTKFIHPASQCTLQCAQCTIQPCIINSFCCRSSSFFWHLLLLIIILWPSLTTLRFIYSYISCLFWRNFILVSLRKRLYCLDSIIYCLGGFGTPQETPDWACLVLVLPWLLIPRWMHPVWFAWVYLQTQHRLALNFIGLQLSQCVKTHLDLMGFLWENWLLWNLVHKILLNKKTMWHD